jgi:uncharacterized protein YjbI with pentapeptide repeats
MANPEHLEILNQGVKAWNEWRREHLGVIPVLSDADLRDANLRGAVLRDAVLRDADLRSADLIGADLSSAVLNYADLSDAGLSDADLSRAELIRANLSRAELSGADFTDAILVRTTFANNDLSEVKGLETVIHEGPSSIGVDTLYKSAGNIPEAFLRGCGVPEPFIVQIPALVAALEPIQFYSCFISHSSKDHPFAERLHADLQSKGVRCWFAPEDLKIGAEIRIGIDESIRVHDKLLLVLSDTSVKSQWVQQEVETALAKEREQGRTVLFPIRLDDAVMQVSTGWPAYLKNIRNIGDFTRWKDHDSYQKAFERLLLDLRAEEKAGN